METNPKNPRNAGRKTIQNAKEVCVKVPFFRVAEVKSIVKQLQKDTTLVKKLIDKITPISEHPDFNVWADKAETVEYEIKHANYLMYFTATFEVYREQFDSEGAVTKFSLKNVNVSQPILVYGENVAEYYDVFDKDEVMKNLLPND